MHKASWLLLILAVVTFCGLLKGTWRMYEYGKRGAALLITFVPSLILLAIGAICAIVAEVQLPRWGGVAILTLYVVTLILLLLMLRASVEDYKSSRNRA